MRAQTWSLPLERACHHQIVTGWVVAVRAWLVAVWVQERALLVAVRVQELLVVRVLFELSDKLYSDVVMPLV